MRMLVNNISLYRVNGWFNDFEDVDDNKLLIFHMATTIVSEPMLDRSLQVLFFLIQETS